MEDWEGEGDMVDWEEGGRRGHGGCGREREEETGKVGQKERRRDRVSGAGGGGWGQVDEARGGARGQGE